MTALPDRHIYHITHLRNLPAILSHGALLPDTAMGSVASGFTDIGMPSIKARRRTIQIKCGPGGCVADYVPFYFGPRSPMLFSISRGKVPTYRDGQDPIVYLVTTVNTIRARAATAVFKDGNAGAAYTQFFEDDPFHLERTIDWPLMRARFWNDTADDPDRCHRRQAEYLVNQRVPVEDMRWLGVRNAARQAETQRILDKAGVVMPILVRPAWYY